MKKKRLRQAENASSPDEHEPLSETGGEDISEKEDVSRKENVSGKEKPHRYDASDIFANLSKEQLFEVCAVLRDMKRNHPGVPLVEVDSADGDHILIRL